MEITNREITNRVTQILTTVNYNDGCIKRIKIYKEYAGNKKTPALRFKTVTFRYPDGTIDEDRTYTHREIIDKSDERDAEYANRETKMLKTIDHSDGFTKTVKIWKIYKDNTPLCRCRTIRYSYPNKTINEDRLYESMLINEKDYESDAEYF